MQTKDIQGKLWSAAPADWVKHLEPTFIPLYSEVFRQIQIDEETMLLDAGCGSGLFLSMAVATGAQLQGIDAAPGLLQVAKERLPQVPLLLEDLEALPFIDGTFDIVTGLNSFQYAGSFENALKEARRVTDRKGHVIMGIWGKEEDCDTATALQPVMALLPTASPYSPGPFTVSEEGKVEAVCEKVGLKLISKHTVFCPWQFSGQEDLLAAFLCTAPCVKAAEVVGQEKVKEAIITGAQPFELADGVYYMKNYFTVFITQKINTNQ
jgi:SAM-dependent methyltransferase